VAVPWSAVSFLIYTWIILCESATEHYRSEIYHTDGVAIFYWGKSALQLEILVMYVHWTRRIRAVVASVVDRYRISC